LVWVLPSFIFQILFPKTKFITTIHQCSLRHCSILYHTATHCIALQHTATHCNTLQHTVHCNALQHKHTHHECSLIFSFCFGTHNSPVLPFPLQRTATNYSALQHTTAHCTLQCAATHTCTWWVLPFWIRPRARSVLFGCGLVSNGSANGLLRVF